MLSLKGLMNGSLAAGIVAATAGLATVMPGTDAAYAQSSVDDRYANLPNQIVLTGVVRDFREKTAEGGHPDFENRPAGGFGHYMGNLSPTLDADKKPVFVGGGKRVSTQWRTADGKNIHPGLFNTSLGDRVGAYTGSADPGGITSAASFAQWYRDVPGVNMSKDISITLLRQRGTNMYVFDDRSDPYYQSRSGFFPINSDLFGNSRNETKNFHFTFELSTEFVFKPNTGQTFTFIGDDDVWVYINDQLVIDLGGVHGAINQTVHLDRLSFLEPDKRATLRVFHAERHRTQSNFRIETTINLKNAELATTSSLYD